MKIAIIGAGLAGLSLCYYLQRSSKASVTLFDAKGIGCGASAVASGLVHPYVGEQVRRSVMATEAIQALHELLEVAQSFTAEPFVDRQGIQREVDTVELQERMLAHCVDYGDVIHLNGKKFLITSGLTLHTETYLQALWLACASHGACFERRTITDLSCLDAFDMVVIAAGAGSIQFGELKPLKLKPTRGQLLVCNWPLDLHPLPYSLVGKGYIAKSPHPHYPYVSIGSTYERGRVDEEPDAAVAISLLAPKCKALYPQLILDPIEVRAGVRLSPKGHYLPLAGPLSKRLWVLTGFGSRGLLYHAFLGRSVASAILLNDPSQLPAPIVQQLSNNLAAVYSGIGCMEEV